MWAGVAVMGVLFVHVALRGPKNTTATVRGEDGTEATETGPARPSRSS